MRRFLLLLLCLALSPAAALGDGLSWTVPEGWTAYLPEEAEEAAVALGTDAAALAQALTESGTRLLLLSQEGSMLQLTAGTAAVEGMDFDAMGRKRVTILAESLAASSGEEATVLRLTRVRSEQPEPTDPPGSHRCGWWILLSPKEDGTLSLLTACRGTELTVYITAAEGRAEDALADAEALAVSLIVTEE